MNHRRAVLRGLRGWLAGVGLLLATALFVDFTGTASHWFGWLAKVQLLPAILAMNVVVVAVLLGVTLLAGRLYCSVVCPLGVLQDVVSRSARWRRPNRFVPAQARPVLRYALAVVFLLAAALGAGSLCGLLDPYSAFGRIVSSFLGPVYASTNNGLASLAEQTGSFAFARVDVWAKSVATYAIAGATLGVVTYLAWQGGRSYCNTVCPVGTILGAFSRFSWLRLRIESDRCSACGACARACPAACIDCRTRQIDASRCVMCLDCLERCRTGALRFGGPGRSRPLPDGVAQQPPGGASRRRFVSGAAVWATALIARAEIRRFDGGLAVIADKVPPQRTAAIAPAGAVSRRDFERQCTGCLLCVTACPNQVLAPSRRVERLVQPELSFERGYCRPECTKCSEVCPSGAIHRVTRQEKAVTRIGQAAWIEARCIVNRDKVACDTCARHCPTGAIRMTPRAGGVRNAPRIPVIDPKRCTGCGACEYLCPSRPLSAIHVVGLERHDCIEVPA
jgi:polyferredoxin